MLHKSKLMLPILAAIIGVAASAFTVKPLTKASNTVYVYNSTDQSIQARETASNYIKGSEDCSGSGDECSVTLNQDFGTNPNFTNVTFDSQGFPDGGSAFLSNAQQTPTP
jgi:hypothetical protein